MKVIFYKALKEKRQYTYSIQPMWVIHTHIVRTLRIDYKNHKHTTDTMFIGKSPTFIT